MQMTYREFKKLLIDLDVTLTDIAAAVDISRVAVRYYFSGRLTNPKRRAAIKRYLARAAREQGVDLPEFWPDVQAA